MNLYRIVSEVIDFRSFSNIWYWIALAVTWSMASHWVLGVPYDMISRAARRGGQVAEDVEAMVGINARRMLGLSREAAVVLFFALALFSSSLLILAFWYWIEFAQALSLLILPMILVFWLSLRAALVIEEQALAGEALFHHLMVHRRKVQAIGMLAIFVTALFGMWRNLTYSILN